jgi:predicted nuclease of predicted toxin-antitoxin system
MADQRPTVLLDQNVPVAVADWLRHQRPQWQIDHVNELGFAGRSDEFLYRYAQDHKSVIITFDEHFADARSHPLGRHYGVVRLRVWPTTTEATINAVSRLLSSVSENDWRNSLIIVDNHRIRVRRLQIR